MGPFGPCYGKPPIPPTGYGEKRVLLDAGNYESVRTSAAVSGITAGKSTCVDTGALNSSFNTPKLDS
jgi:hypothetical protein